MVSSERSLTYAQVVREALRLAGALAARGVGAGDRVAISSEDGVEQTVAMLGILGAGAAYVPIDPAWPAERKRLAVARAEPKAVVGQPLVAPGRAPLVVSPSSPDSAPLTGFAARATNDLTYLLLTSGSTGTPKAVAMPDGPLERLVSWQVERSAMAPGARTLRFAPLSFDVSFQEVFATLCAGGTLVTVAETVRKDLVSLPRRLDEAAVERIFVPFVVLQHVARSAEVDGVVLTALREINTAGEQLRATPTLHAFVRRRPWLRIFNQYGPTETHVVTEYELPADPNTWPDLPAIGRPVAGASLRVVDERLDDVPAGATGELLVSGNLADGYWADDALTAERFVTLGGGRWYRTGDHGYLARDGHLHFVGRSDHQVKIRGVRVELGEIESVLGSHPAVRAAAVVTRDEDLGKRLVAYASVDPTRPVGSADLRSFLEARLPAACVPRDIRLLDALPLTESRKIDRRALERMAGAVVADVRPRNGDLLTDVAVTLGRALRRPPLDPDESFFTAGGDSLSAASAAVELRQLLDLDVTLAEILSHSSPRALAHWALEMRSAARPNAAPVAYLADHELTRVEDVVWSLEQHRPGAYQVVEAWEFAGELEPERLHRAACALVAAHPALRRAFRYGDSGLSRAQLPAEAWRGWELLPSSNDELWRARLLAPLNPASGDLCRFVAQRVEPGRWRVAAVVHHLAADAESSRILWSNLGKAYAGSALGELDPPRFRRMESSGELLAAAGNVFSGARGLPSLRPRPALPASGLGWVEVCLGPDRAAQLARLCAQEDCTTLVGHLAIFATMLSDETLVEDVAFGTMVSLRGGEASPDGVGLATTAVPVQVRCQPHSTFREELRAAKGALAQSVRAARVPISKLLPAADAETIFQVMLVDQGRLEAPELEGIPAERLRVDGLRPRATLVVSRELVAGDERLLFEFDRSCLEPDDVRGMGEEWLARIDRVLQAGDKPRSSLPATSASAPEAPSPATRRFFLELFDEQVRARPRQTAIEGSGQVWTYEELHARSGRIARSLRSRGVRKGDRVAVHLPHVPEAIATLVGILRAGGVYVPLDPLDPVDRTQHILEAVAARVGVGRSVPSDASRSVEWLSPAGEDGEPFDDPTLEPSDPAYIIFTSGSTGKPKGAVITHGGLGNLVLRHPESIGRLEPVDRVLAFSSLTFDASIWETLGPLGHGATLVFEPRERLLPGPGLVDLMRSRRISVVTLTPTVLARLNPFDLPDLRLVISAGEPISWSLAERWAHGRWFANAYGPTEASVCATVYLVEAGEVPAARVRFAAPPIGRPLPGVRLKVLDPWLRPVRRGAVGELWIAGVGVGAGYVGAPELSAERFAPDPQGGGRMYRTGDRVRVSSDGVVEYMGRGDDQVKVNGVRIEPGEVEAVLEAHPLVQDAAVAVEGEELVAYLCPKEAGRRRIEGIRQFARRQLPRHLVPTRFYAIPALPRGFSGKLDRRRLGGGAGDADPPDRRAPAEGEIEVRLAAIWKDVLGLQALPSRHDVFSELGGTSLTHAEVHTRCVREFEVDLSTEDLYEASDLADLARRIQGARLSGAERGEGIMTSPVPPVRSPSSTGETVIVTGATGFVGIHVAAELVRRGRAVALMIRGESHDEARARLLSAAGRFRIDAKLLSDCPIWLADLTQSRFDGDEIWKRRASSLVHCAANTRFTDSYEVLRRVNVRGTAALLQWAAGAGVPLWYVSSLSVFGDPGSHSEADVPGRPPRSPAYARTKWEAENLARAFALQGHPVGVTRLGWIGVSTATEALPAGDFLFRVVLSGLDLGMLPRWRSRVLLTSVDWAARALATLVEHRVLRTTHLVGQAVGFEVLADALALRQVESSEWVAALSAAGPGTAAYSLLPLLRDVPSEGPEYPTVERKVTEQLLGRLALGTDEPAQSLANAYAAACRRRWSKAPRAQGGQT